FRQQIPHRLFSNYPAVSPPLGLRWEADANTPLCSVNATRSPPGPALRKESKGAGLPSPLQLIT
ncbi:MAG: hypothetical protein RSF35_03580, partial [Akkermansia sp.]